MSFTRNTFNETKRGSFGMFVSRDDFYDSINIESPVTLHRFDSDGTLKSLEINVSYELEFASVTGFKTLKMENFYKQELKNVQTIFERIENAAKYVAIVPVVKNGDTWFGISFKYQDNDNIGYALFVNACDDINMKGSLGVDNFYLQVKEALIAFHRNGLCHCDIKPANIVRCDGQFKLIDFGSLFDVKTGEINKGFSYVGLTPTMISPWYHIRARIFGYKATSQSQSQDNVLDVNHIDIQKMSDEHVLMKNDMYALALSLIDMFRLKRDDNRINDLLNYNPSYTVNMTDTGGGSHMVTISGKSYRIYVRCKDPKTHKVTYMTVKQAQKSKSSR